MSAYKQGYMAYVNAYKLHHNPFDKVEQFDQWACWRDGYLKAASFED